MMGWDAMFDGSMMWGASVVWLLIRIAIECRLVSIGSIPWPI
jgi:hypothetical protein